ncbi:tyrosine-type recombinase/integrase [Comamonas thiooxydans]|uniref:tyrosine-type recombinase/integrase n=1 Tax=Comamonas thiooxydans TaxID=363952 RepID=UPI0005500329|nr:site-specific integrase [Comamonas thiooxydans]
MSLEIRKLQRPDGQLWPFLLFKGKPLILPNLWVNEHVSASRPNTAEAYLRDVALVYETAALKSISIKTRLSSLQGFSTKEIRIIARALSRTKTGSTASKATCDRRAESMQSFLQYGFEYFKQVKALNLIEQAQADKNKNYQYRLLRKRINEEKNKGKGPNYATELNKKEIAIIDYVMNPISELNPFKDHRVRVRNYCIFRILYSTGIRRSELVLLELNDVNLGGSPSITIRSPSVSNKSKRRDGASLKTLGRELPITLELAQELEIYQDIWRPQFSWPKRPSPALLLSSKDGRRLCTNTINQIFESLNKVPVIRNMGKRIHPHGLRATGMNEIRRKIQKSEKGNDPALHEALAYVGGWVYGSPMVSHYTRAAISENLAKDLRKKEVDNE